MALFILWGKSKGHYRARFEFQTATTFQNVNFIDKRLLTLDNVDSEPMLTAEKQRMVIDWYVRWRISDPSQYIRNVGLMKERVPSNSRAWCAMRFKKRSTNAR